MSYGSVSAQSLRVHEHPSDQSCHWISVFEPLAFLVLHNPVLIQTLAQSSHGKGIKQGIVDEAEYARWLCGEGDRGRLNLLNVLLHVCELRGVPTPLCKDFVIVPKLSLSITKLDRLVHGNTGHCSRHRSAF
jgi:hypothetical protein